MSARLQSKRGCLLNMDREMSFMETVCSKREKIKEQNYIRGWYTHTHPDKEIHDELCIFVKGVVWKLGWVQNLKQKQGCCAFKINILDYFIFINVRFKVRNVMHLYFFMKDLRF